MNARERFLETAHFGKPDRVPLGGFGPRKATFERWRREGMPADVHPRDYFDYWYDESWSITGLPDPGKEWNPDQLREHAINLGPIPSFEQTILEQNERYRVWIDSLGIKQRGFRTDWDDGWSGFATRQFLEFPVKTRVDFLKMKERYDPRSPERYPEQWWELTRLWKHRDYPLGLALRGPFDWTRDMMGLHQMILSFYRDPELVREIMDFSADFQVEALRKALNEIEVDSATISEDMAYNAGPMISLKMVREFMLPAYKKITSFLRDRGVDIIVVDSDGNVESLIPLWLEAGINGITPCEQCDPDTNPVVLRKRYSRLIIIGGIDKRELAKDKKAVEREIMSKVPYLIKTGGYFPGVDHAVPADIPLENFQYFLELMRKICQKSE